MPSIVTVTAAPTVTALTTLERVKQELGITNGASDALLTAKIAEATSDIEAHLGRSLARATVSQMTWGDPGWAGLMILDRTPVVSIGSVTIDDDAVDAEDYRLDGATGFLYRLDGGYPCAWSWCQGATIVYTGGYLMPGEAGRNLPEAIEAGAISLVQSFWANKGRDPLIKGEDVPGLGRVDYWVGAVGEAGSLPPDVWSKVAAYRRTRQA